MDKPGSKPGQEPGHFLTPGFFLALCHLKGACLVLEGSQAVYRHRGAERQEGRRDLRGSELSYQNLISLPLEKEKNKHQRTLCY